VGPARILYICDLNAHGGTQTHLLQILAGLDRARYAPALAALTLADDLKAIVAPLGIDVIDMAVHGALKPATFRSVVSLGNLARRGRVDLLHGFLYQGNVVTAAVSQLSGAPFITSVRNMDRWKTPVQRQISRLAHLGAARVVFNAEATREETVAREAIRRERTAVIPNGVSMPPSSGLAARGDRPPTIVCVASLSPKKGHALLLDAFTLVRQAIPAARLHLVGAGALRERLEWRAREMGLDEAVRFLGHREDIDAILAEADVAVLTSVEEGMPNAILEAMARGLPAVATDVGGNREVIDDGTTGLLAPAGDKEAVAKALVRLLTDHDLRRRMGEAGRDRAAERFGLAAMLDAYMRLYDEVLRRGQGSRP